MHLCYSAVLHSEPDEQSMSHSPPSISSEPPSRPSSSTSRPISSTPSQPSSATSGTSRSVRTRRPPSGGDELEELLLARLSQPKERKIEDENDLFSKQVAMALRRVSNPRVRGVTKLHIQQLLLEAEFPEDPVFCPIRSPPPPPSPSSQVQVPLPSMPQPIASPGSQYSSIASSTDDGLYNF